MSETKKFFRAVSRAELEGWRESGQLKAGRNSLEGKYFTDSLDHALDWWRSFEAHIWYGTEDGGAVLQVEVPSDVVEEFEYMSDMDDGIGPAWYACVIGFGRHQADRTDSCVAGDTETVSLRRREH